MADSKPTRGKKAIASIIAASATDLIESEQMMTTLEDIAPAPATQVMRDYWFDLFNAFTSATLRIDERMNKTPTGADVAQFFATIPKHLAARRNSGQISWTYIQVGRKSLDHCLNFAYPDFKTSRNEELRIDAVLQKLLKDGRLTKDPVREKLWLTCGIVKEMTTAIFADAINNGAKCWDVTVSDCLSLVLQAALAARSGDFKRSVHYTGEEYLQWRDIKMVVVGQERAELQLNMLITLRYRKGCKADGSKNMEVELGQLDDYHSTVDPTKLLLAYALRIGAVEEQSWDDLIDGTLMRPNKQVLWKDAYAKLPVFFAKTQGQRLDFSKPARGGQQNTVVRYGADLIGMLEVPRSHDLRRGAAADVAQLEGSPNMEAVRRTLGHGYDAMHSGTTDEYMGRYREDTWLERVNQQDGAAPDPFAVVVTPQTFKKRRVGTQDINEYCASNELDKNKRTSRVQARKDLVQEQRDQWATTQENVMNGKTPATERKPLKDITNVVAASAVGQRSNKASSSATSKLTQVDKIDPRLRVFEQALFISGTNSTDLTSDTAIDELLVESVATVQAMQDTQSTANAPVLTADIDTFVTFMSRINLVSLASQPLPSTVESGNSRNPPSRFWFTCADCSHKFITQHRLNEHMPRCNGPDADSDSEDDTNLEDVQTSVPTSGRGKKREITADTSEAESAVETVAPQPKKRKKKKPMDPGFPKQCPDKEQCGVRRDLVSKASESQHRRKYHDTEWPRGLCNVPDCPNPRKTIFISQQKFREHLHGYHGFDHDKCDEYISQILPTKKKVAAPGTRQAFQSTTCLFPGCTSTHEFKDYNNYQKHLRKVHELAVNDVHQYVTKGTTAA